eukprot:sb/3472023/
MGKVARISHGVALCAAQIPWAITNSVDYNFSVLKGEVSYLQDQVPVDDGLHVIRATRGNAWLDGLKLKYPKLSKRVNATSKLRRRRPSVYLPKVWNKLPLNLTAVESVESFKSKLKTSLFADVFVVEVLPCQYINPAGSNKCTVRSNNLHEFIGPCTAVSLCLERRTPSDRFV